MNKLLPRRWQKQPQTPVEIDWSHPLARGITGLWIFNKGIPYNLVTGEKSVLNASYPITRKVSKAGVGYRSAQLQLAANTNSLISSTGGTLFADFDGSETLSTYFVTSGGSGAPYFGFFAVSATNGNNIYFNAGLSNSSSRAPSTINVVNAGRKKVLASYGTENKKIYSNGVLNATNTVAHTSFSIETPFYLGGSDAAALAPDSFFSVVATWNRQLSDKEAAEASRNIYQLLRPSVNKLYPDFIPAVIDVDLPFPAPIFDAEMVVVEENQTLFDIDLNTSAPNFNASLLKGEVIPIDLPLQAPDIFLDIGQVNRFSMALPMPSVGINIAMDTGIVMPISLPLPVPEIESDLAVGQLLNLNLDLPVFDISLGFGEGFAFDVPAPRLEADIRVGNVVSFALDMPTPNLSIELFAERALAFDLPLPGINVEIALRTGSLIDIAIDLSSPTFNAEINAGALVNAMLDVSEIDLELDFNAGAFMYMDMNIPLPLFSASVATDVVATGKFYNRWTR